MHRLCSLPCEKAQHRHPRRLSRSWEVLSQRHYQISPVYQVPRTHLETPLSIAPNPKAGLEWVGDSNSFQLTSFKETGKEAALGSQWDQVQKLRCEICCCRCNRPLSRVRCSRGDGDACQEWPSSLRLPASGIYEGANFRMRREMRFADRAPWVALREASITHMIVLTRVDDLWSFKF